MTTQYLAEGELLPFTAPTGGVIAHEPVLIGVVVVIPKDTVAATEEFVGHVRGRFLVPKPNQAWTEGALVYWNNTASNFTTTAGSNTRAGYAIRAVASGAANFKARSSSSATFFRRKGDRSWTLERSGNGRPRRRSPRSVFRERSRSEAHSLST